MKAPSDGNPSTPVVAAPPRAMAPISGAFGVCNEALTPPPPDLLKQHKGERLHQAVEGLLRDALGVAALQVQSPGFSTALQGTCLPQAARATSAHPPPGPPSAAGRLGREHRQSGFPLGDGRLPL